jgi:hypothetical protein
MTAMHGIDLAGASRHAVDMATVRVNDIERQTATANELLQRLAHRPVQLLADEVGMGKTYVALAVASALRAPGQVARVAVLVPNDELVKKWEREVRDFMAACVVDQRLKLHSPTGDGRFSVQDLGDLSWQAPRRQLAVIRYGSQGLASKQFREGDERLAAAAWALSTDHKLADRKARLRRVFGAGPPSAAPMPDQWMVGAVRALKGTHRPLLPLTMPTGKKAWAASHIEGRSGDELWTEAVEAVNAAPLSSNAALAAAVRPSLRRLVFGGLIAKIPPFDVVIIDEAHNWVNRAKGANAARLAYLHRARRALLLTATPLQLAADDLPNLLGQFTDLGRFAKPRPQNPLAEELRAITAHLGAAAGAAERLRVAWAAAPPDTAITVTQSAAQIDHPALQAAVEDVDHANRQLETTHHPWLVRHRRSRGHRRVLVGEEFGAESLGDSRPPLAEGTVLHAASGTVDDGAQLAQLALMRLVALAESQDPGRTTLGASMTGCYSTIEKSKEAKHLLTKEPLARPYRALLKPHIDAERRLLDRKRVQPAKLHPKLRALLGVVEQLWAQGDKVLIYCWRLNTARVVAAAVAQQLGLGTSTGTWRLLQQRLSRGLLPSTLDRLVHSLCLAGRIEVPYHELVRGSEAEFAVRVTDLHLPGKLTPQHVRAVHDLHQAVLARSALPRSDDGTRILLQAFVSETGHVGETAAAPDRSHERIYDAITHEPSLFTGPIAAQDGARPPAALARSIARYCDRWQDPSTILRRRHELTGLLVATTQSQQTLARLPGLPSLTHPTAGQLAAAVARPMRSGGRSVGVESFLERLAHLVDSLTSIEDERNLDDAFSELRTSQDRTPVAEVSGKTRVKDRNRTFERFNSPLFPDVLVCTQIAGEGIDLQRFCRVVIHYDLSFNPAKFEQRTGRCDRIGSKAEREGADLVVGVPLLAGSYDERIYATLLQRDREQEALIGGGIGGEQGLDSIDQDLEDGPEETGIEGDLALPKELVELLRCKYHVWSTPAGRP